MRVANFSHYCQSIPCMCFAFFFLILLYIKKRRELALESQTITTFVLFNTLIFDCYTCANFQPNKHLSSKGIKYATNSLGITLFSYLRAKKEDLVKCRFLKP